MALLMVRLITWRKSSITPRRVSELMRERHRPRTKARTRAVMTFMSGSIATVKYGATVSAAAWEAM